MERPVVATVWGPTSVDTIKFPTVLRRSVWHLGQQLQSADCPFQSFHQPLQLRHSRETQEQMEAV